jgi:hypothetical protein
MKNSPAAAGHPEEVAAATEEGSLYLLDSIRRGRTEILLFAQNHLTHGFSATGYLLLLDWFESNELHGYADVVQKML